MTTAVNRTYSYEAYQPSGSNSLQIIELEEKIEGLMKQMRSQQGDSAIKSLQQEVEGVIAQRDVLLEQDRRIQNIMPDIDLTTWWV